MLAIVDQKEDLLYQNIGAETGHQRRELRGESEPTRHVHSREMRTWNLETLGILGARASRWAGR